MYQPLVYPPPKALTRPRPTAFGDRTFLACAAWSLVTAWVAGCSDAAAVRPGDIRTYTAPAPAKPLVQRPAAPARVGLELSYDPPPGWTDRGASGMRLATLVIDGPGRQHEVTVIPASGTLEANVARWLGQLDAEATPESLAKQTAEVVAAAEKVSVGTIEANVVSLIKAEASDDDEVILGAMIPIDESASLFVKLKGPAVIARQEREAFTRFVSSIRWK